MSARHFGPCVSVRIALTLYRSAILVSSAATIAKLNNNDITMTMAPNNASHRQSV